MFRIKLLQTIADICADLSAAWFATILILPGITSVSSVQDWLLLTKNLVFGTVFLVTSTWIKTKI